MGKCRFWREDKGTKGSRGVIVYYADEEYHDINKINAHLAEAKRRLAKEGKIAFDRIDIVFGGFRGGIEFELWIVPKNGEASAFNSRKKEKLKQQNKMNIAQMNKDELEIDLPNGKLAYTIIQSFLQGHEALSDLLVVMSHALDEDVVKALTNTNEWENYLASKRELENTKLQIEKFT